VAKNNRSYFGYIQRYNLNILVLTIPSSKLSIVTICLNDSEGLEKTILSVANQSFRDYEHLVIDGGSTDGTLEVVERNRHNLTYFISEKDNGRYNAMNKGIEIAKGKYCLFLNSGDYLVADDVLQMVFNKGHKDDILYGNLMFEIGELKEIYIQPNEIDFKYLMNATIAHPAAFIKKELFSKYGMYDESYLIAGDYDLFLRLVVKHQVKTCYLPILISTFNSNGISNDDSFKNIQNKERERAQLNNVSKIVLDCYLEYVDMLNRYSSIDTYETNMSNKIKTIPILGTIQKWAFNVVELLVVLKRKLGLSL